jgi:5-methylcytosine-specific restriction endonuclease McrA
MSESRKQYFQTLSEEDRGKQRERLKGRTGPNSNHWKGGNTMTPCKTCHISFPVKPYLVGKVTHCSRRCRREDPDKKSPLHKRIRASVEYKAWRKAVFERDNWTCQMCSGRGGILQADHIKPFALFPELRFDVSNGRTLCLDCHSKTETFGVHTWRRKAFLLQQAQEETTEP